MMARAGWVKPRVDERLSDHISIGLLTRVFAPDVIDGVVEAAGRTQQRVRLLPSRVVMYYVLGLALFGGSSYEEVMRMLVDGLSWSSGWKTKWTVPTKGALFKARDRLGVEPMQALYDAVAVPLGLPGSSAFYGEWRVVSIDGTTIDLPDTLVNVERFGRPSSSRGEKVSAFPQARVAALAECGTRAIISAAIGAYSVGERTLARQLKLVPGMLCIADRGFYGFDIWNEMRSTGADLLWRTKKNHRLPVLETHDDGSYTTELAASTDPRRQNTVRARVIEYRIDDPTAPDRDTTYRLLTTILDPSKAPANELAQLYAQRWQIESAFDELKVHQGGADLVLRSKTPTGVLQEIYAHLCVHYAIRTVMYDVASQNALEPERISYIRTLRVARRTTASHAGFSPQDTRRRS